MNLREVLILVLDFVVMNVKIILLLGWDVYNNIFPEEKNIKGHIVLVINLLFIIKLQYKYMKGINTIHLR